MADSIERAVLIARIADLREQQLQGIRDATVIGWTAESVEAHKGRRRKIAELRRQLANLDEAAS